MVSIRVLSIETEKAYADLVSRASMGMLYHSIKYRNFLGEILEGARDNYLLAFEEGKLTAAIPVFIKEGPLGTVVNSLPFYGSHGSLVYVNEASPEAKTTLLDAYGKLCLKEEAITSTVISNPLESDESIFEEYRADLIDERIGQFTRLPGKIDPDTVPDMLMSSFHQKTRNMVRKGQKNGFILGHDGSEKTLKSLFLLHDENIKAIGGLPKSWKIFQAIKRNFIYDRDYRVYTATKNGEIVSALLIYYHKDVAEYSTPTIRKDCRPYQPLSYLIFQAMLDASVRKGCNWWNWGGTWLSQGGVYRFKSRWGTQDMRYKYYIREYHEHGSFRDCSAEQLLSAYPNFYTIPFSILNSN